MRKWIAIFQRISSTSCFVKRSGNCAGWYCSHFSMCCVLSLRTLKANEFGNRQCYCTSCIWCCSLLLMWWIFSWSKLTASASVYWFTQLLSVHTTLLLKGLFVEFSVISVATNCCVFIMKLLNLLKEFSPNGYRNGILWSSKNECCWFSLTHKNQIKSNSGSWAGMNPVVLWCLC